MALKEIAIGKRAAIDKASKKMFASTAGASLVLGLAIVGAIYFIKCMIFNGTVISKQDEIIAEYEVIQNNLAQLKDNIMGDGSEENGTPNGLANNVNLEVVARNRDIRNCYDLNGKLKPNDDGDVYITRSCSALRVIPDALPSVNNVEATYSSLNQLYRLTMDEKGDPVDPESISSGGSSIADPASGLSTIPISLSVRHTGTTTKAVLDSIERSIRNIDIRNASIAWISGRNDNGELMSDIIELRGTAVAYFSTPITATTEKKYICADPKQTIPKSNQAKCINSDQTTAPEAGVTRK